MHRIWGFLSVLTGGRVYVRRPSETGGIHLTFDDGPHPEFTPRVLDLLARHDVRATFFLLGERIAHQEAIVRRIVAAGHLLGNHSYTHPAFRSISLARQLREITRTDALLSEFDGLRLHPFRPPSGRPTLGTIALCMARRSPMALWTHDSLDYQGDAGAVVARLKEKHMVPGDIVLFHDDSATGLTALDVLLPHWRSVGLKFATLDPAA